MADLSSYDGPIIPLDNSTSSQPQPTASTQPVSGPALAAYDGPIVPLASQTEPNRGFVQGLRDWAGHESDLSDMPSRYAKGAPDWYRENVAPIVALPEAITRKGEAAAARGLASFVQGTEDFSDVATQKNDPHTQQLRAQIAQGKIPEDINAALSVGASPFNPEGPVGGSAISSVRDLGSRASNKVASLFSTPQAAQNLQDFAQSGITPTAPAVTESHSMGNVANVAKEVPIFGEPIISSARQNIDEAAARNQQIAAGYGAATDDKSGGEALREGYAQFKYGPTGERNPPSIENRDEIFQPTRKVGMIPKSEALYDDIKIAPETTANVNNTTAALTRLSNQFPSNPELNQILSTPTFSRLLKAIRPSVHEVASESPVIMPTGRGFVTGPSASPIISGADSRLAGAPSSPTISFGESGFQFTPEGRTSVQSIAPGYNVYPAGQPAIASTEPGFATTTATELQPTGGMSWQDLKNFRSYVGRQMREPSDALGLGRDDWKALYGAISQDMKSTASSQGADALRGFNRANSYYSAALDRLNSAMGFVDKAASDEGAFNALMSKGAAGKSTSDIDRFTATVKSLPDEFRGNVASAVVSRMGKPTPGQAVKGPFSIQSWNTNYAKMSPEAKDALFGPTGTSQRDDMEALSRSLTSLDSVGRLGNPSGTGRYAMVEKYGPLGWVPAFIFRPIEAGLAAGTSAATSKFMTSPGVARWIANSSKVTTPSGWANQMSRLGTMAAQNPGVIGPYYKALVEQETGQPQQRATGGRVSAKAINIAAQKADKNPTGGQIRAGNYAKGHCKIHGLDISIENAKGSVRRGKSPDGKAWKCKMICHYGYVRGSVGADSDQVDVFIGPNHKSDKVYVIDQLDHKTDKFDEHKAMLGFDDIGGALDNYARSFSDGHGVDRIGNVKVMSIDQFKDWLRHGDTTNAIAA